MTNNKKITINGTSRKGNKKRTHVLIMHGTISQSYMADLRNQLGLLNQALHSDNPPLLVAIAVPDYVTYQVIKL